MVNGFCSCCPAIAQAFQTQVSVTLKYPGAPDIPLTAVTPLVSALAALMLLPAFIDMVRAVS